MDVMTPSRMASIPQSAPLTLIDLGVLAVAEDGCRGGNSRHTYDQAWLQWCTTVSQV